MKKTVREQLSEDEYEKFGTLFRCSNTKKMASELLDVLRTTFSMEQTGKANNIAAKINDVFLEHLNEVQIEIDFYESPEAENYEKAQKINNERLKIEQDFANNLKTFEQIQKRSNSYKSKVKEIGYSIETLNENRKNYPLHPPSSFIDQEDMNTLEKTFEKFLHWKIFLSSDNNADTNVGNPYLYLDLTSKIGAGGLDVVAQKYNQDLRKKIAPILENTSLSVRQMAIIIWAHQFYVSQIYYKRFKYTKNVFIPSLSALIKDV